MNVGLGLVALELFYRPPREAAGRAPSAVLPSMQMTESLDSRPRAPAATARQEAGGEQRFVVHGVSFKDYVVLREVLDVPGLRMTYCEGVLELIPITGARG